MGPYQRLYTNPGRWHQPPFLCPLMPSLHHRRPQDRSGMICPWWSHVGCPGAPPHLLCVLTSLPQVSAPWSYQVQRWSSLACSSPDLPFTLSWIWEWCFPFFSVTGDFEWQTWFFKNNREQLGNHISQFLQNLMMHVVWPHRLAHTWSHEAVLNLLFSYTVGNSSESCLEGQGHERHGMSDCHWSLRQRAHWLPQLSPCLLKPFLPSHLAEEVHSPLSLLIGVSKETSSVESLVIFLIPWYVQFICTLAFLIPSLHIQTASLYTSRAFHPSFHCLCISFLTQFDQQVLIQPCHFPTCSAWLDNPLTVWEKWHSVVAAQYLGLSGRERSEFSCHRPGATWFIDCPWLQTDGG